MGVAPDVSRLRRDVNAALHVEAWTSQSGALLPSCPDLPGRVLVQALAAHSLNGVLSGRFP